MSYRNSQRLRWLINIVIIILFYTVGRSNPELTGPLFLIFLVGNITYHLKFVVPHRAAQNSYSSGSYSNGLGQGESEETSEENDSES